MQNSNFFFHFTFTPTKLKTERTIVEKKFKDIEKEIAIGGGRKRLPELLERIRLTSIEELPSFVEKLTKMDIRILIYEYPFPNESKATRHKINEILTARYTSLVGRTAWELFQHDTSDEFLQDLIRGAFVREPESFVGMSEGFLKLFKNAIESSDSIVNGLTPFFLKSKSRAVELLKGFKVKEGSLLEAEITKKMFLEGLQENFIIKRDGEEFVSRKLQQYPTNDYKEMLKVYIEPRDYDEFHPSIMNDAIKFRLGDPRTKGEEWSFLSKDAFSQVKRWVLRQNLEEIFAGDADNKRFNYWKRFIRYMDDVELLKEPKVAFIYFKQFVVVEFGNIGAAYFYHVDGFEKHIYPIKNSSRFKHTRSMQSRESMLKIKDEKFKGDKLFIDRLLHIPWNNWEPKFDKKMQIYLSGLDE
jgi:hypothetical protein